jgi:hypothetical protein
MASFFPPSKSVFGTPACYRSNLGSGTRYRFGSFSGLPWFATMESHELRSLRTARPGHTATSSARRSGPCRLQPHLVRLVSFYLWRTSAVAAQGRFFGAAFKSSALPASSSDGTNRPFVMGYFPRRHVSGAVSQLRGNGKAGILKEARSLRNAVIQCDP